MVFDQREVARELVVPVDELLGAVQRVDQPVAVILSDQEIEPGSSSLTTGMSLVSLVRPSIKDVVRREVGPCNRRLV